MNKEYIITFFIIAVSAITIFLIFMFPSQPLKYRTEKVVIDSIIVSNDYGVLPDKTWTYYTKYGPTITTRNKQLFEVGDSVEVKLVKLNQ